VSYNLKIILLLFDDVIPLSACSKRHPIPCGESNLFSRVVRQNAALFQIQSVIDATPNGFLLHGVADSRAAAEGDGLQVWKVAAKILDK
jgi:hypothetical protein